MSLTDSDETHMMIDLETLGTEPGAPVVAAGVVLFTRDEIETQTAYDVSGESCCEHGLDRIEFSSVEWWVEQPPEVRGQIHDGRPLDEFLDELATAIRMTEPAAIWAKDPDFDIAILEAGFEALGKPTPWDYWQTRSVRTLEREFGFLWPERDDEKNTKHDALADARAQARAVSHVLRAVDALEDRLETVPDDVSMTAEEKVRALGGGE